MFHYHSTPSARASSPLVNDTPILPMSFQMLNNRPSTAPSYPQHPNPISYTRPLGKLKRKSPTPTPQYPPMQTSVRPATASDLPACVHIEVASNPGSPIVCIPWPSYSSSLTVFGDRHRFIFERPGEFQFLVATTTTYTFGSDPREEVIGFLIGHRPAIPGVEEWEPNIPDGTNEAFVEEYVGRIKQCKWENSVKELGLWELDTLAIDPRWQRMGVGQRLVDEWTRLVDREGGRAYVLSSGAGKGLYEKFGWREVGTLNFGGLEKYGWVGGEFLLSNMVRETGGSVNVGAKGGRSWEI